jgi:ribosome biogenesis protein BMS1
VRGPAGAFRAAFEDKVLLSDIVFCRAWVPVTPKQFFNPVTSLLRDRPIAAPTDKEKRRAAKRQQDEEGGSEAETEAEAHAQGGAAAQHGSGDDEFVRARAFAGAREGYVFGTGARGTGYYRDGAPAFEAGRREQPAGDEDLGLQLLKTVGRLRYEAGAAMPRNPDSLYRPINRKERKFNPLRISESLQAALPFASKPKDKLGQSLKSKEKAKHRSETITGSKRAVIMTGTEKKVTTLLQQLNTIRKDKTAKRKESKSKSLAERQKKMDQELGRFATNKKEDKKRKYREQGRADKAKQSKRN